MTAPNVMLLGSVGSGKTYSLRTLLASGVELFVIQTEPSEVLDDLPRDKVHINYIPAVPADFAAMAATAKNINTMSYEFLTKSTDANRGKYQQMVKVINLCQDFIDSRTGESFGDVTLWGEDRALVIDSLTGLSKMAMDLVVGGKPTKAMPDWGIAMDMIERLIDTLATNCNCWFILTGHLEPERDEVAGTIQMMPATLGKKLPPKLPRYFSDVVHCVRKGTEFYWSTATGNVDTKARNLPISDKLKPDFKQIKDAWLKRKEAGAKG